ncbi:CGNR zinc finger domain-containing protein [Pyxidicoccus xibeiensis]|uniref:CGNR zinc finger domain-containing protein n=1 Tax=Pyxidicoccus xibeiensis TaxID=2906759 RepID=UPI00389A14B0
MAEGDPRQARRCDHPDCILLFLDTTKNRTRRWCSLRIGASQGRLRTPKRGRPSAETRPGCPMGLVYITHVSGPSDRGRMGGAVAFSGRPPASFQASVAHTSSLSHGPFATVAARDLPTREPRPASLASAPGRWLTRPTTCSALPLRLRLDCPPGTPCFPPSVPPHTVAAPCVSFDSDWPLAVALSS